MPATSATRVRRPAVGVLPPLDLSTRPARAALGLLPGQRRRQRWLEMAPGLLVWAILLAPVAVGFLIVSTNFQYLWILGLGAVALDAYWLFRIIYTVRYVFSGWRLLQETAAVDWMGRCAALRPGPAVLDPSTIVHAVLIPTYTERYEVLRATVEALVAADYPADRKICAMISRVTDTAGCANIARLQAEFGNRFRAFWHIQDPLLPGIVAGKSAAMAYGGPVLKAACDGLGLDPSRVVVTDLDSDFRVHPRYFAHITHEYCAAADRDTSIWQPVPVFSNNYWRVPAPVRCLATFTTQWQFYLHQHPHRLVMFSSYSMALQLLDTVGYWDDDVIPEDSRFFWKAFFVFGERLHVRPAFLPMHGDAPRARDYGGTLVSQYNQIKRWAWGVTDIPYVAPRMLSHPEIPRRVRLQRFRLLLFNHLGWATLPLLILIGGALPSLVNYDYGLSVTGTVLATVASLILQMTLANILVLVVIDNRLHPRPPQWSWWRRRFADGQMAVYPVIFLLLSVLPALEAQTRLLSGSYLEYRVTEKE
ncbi:MAG TPA: glycosyltransferase family 2 protein [Candidatus Dormibacteraeota bacterium]|nr:glycosyltransferase family 2 protein [Candidatus Dormibacteraeota bacterium]